MISTSILTIKENLKNVNIIDNAESTLSLLKNLIKTISIILILFSIISIIVSIFMIYIITFINTLIDIMILPNYQSIIILYNA